MTRSTTILASNISKAFGKKKVISHLSLSVVQGECVLLLGANGSGKTTLMKVLATLFTIDEGDLVIDGLNLSGNECLIRSRIGFLGHEPLVYSHLTVKENLRFYSVLHQISSQNSKTCDVMEFVGLASYRDIQAGMLSHGLIKRISMARIMLYRPKILLLDEPETGLDKTGIVVLEKLIKENKSNGGSVIIATHNPEITGSLADKILVLNDGKAIPSVV